jgi:hypothetical protein
MPVAMPSDLSVRIPNSLRESVTRFELSAVTNWFDPTIAYSM